MIPRRTLFNNYKKVCVLSNGVNPSISILGIIIAKYSLKIGKCSVEIADLQGKLSATHCELADRLFLAKRFGVKE